MAAMFRDLRAGLSLVGFEAPDVAVLFRILAAILHIGDVVRKLLLPNIDDTFSRGS